MTTFNIPRLVISAPSSGSGKSTITTGLMAALAQQHQVQGFKAGPDYIDPGYHTAVTGKPSRNLDTWMLPQSEVQRIFAHATHSEDIAIIEGVMGLYDGFGALTDRGSTAELAKLLQAPVIVVIDASAMARTAGAIVLGMRDFDPDLNVIGVICNRVGSHTHARWLTEAIEAIGLPVLGCIPRMESLTLAERHLGLHMVTEQGANLKNFLDAAASVVRENIDLEKLCALAQTAPPLKLDLAPYPIAPSQGVRIAIARDAAFCFYYEDNFDYLRRAGADLVEFSPLNDAQLPESIHGLYLGGGYPELYGQQLVENQSMMAALEAAIDGGMPTYAECGGLMLLTEAIVDQDGERYPMLGLLPGYAVMRDRVRLGYREIRPQQDNLLGQVGDELRGHEFHYSDWVERGFDWQAHGAYQVQSRYSDESTVEGFALGNLLASYVHLHFGTNPRLSERFVDHCLTFKVSV